MIAAVDYAQEVSGLKITEKFVLVTIAHHLNSKSLVAWPSIATLAGACSMNERTVYRALAKLEQINEIKRLHSEANHCTVYQMPGFEARECLRCSPNDRMSPRQNVTPDRNDTTPLTETTTTPDRNDNAYKEERELIQRERERDKTAPLSLSKVAPKSTPPPAALSPTHAAPPASWGIPGVYGDPARPVLNWPEYLQGLAKRGRLSRVQERAIVNDLVFEQDRIRDRMEPMRDTLAAARKCYGL